MGVSVFNIIQVTASCAGKLKNFEIATSARIFTIIVTF